MDEARRQSIAASYIEYIKIAVGVLDSSAPFRDFLDNWYAFSETSAGLLSKGGRPIWFNNPDVLRLGDQLKRMHYISADAMKIIESAGPDGSTYRLRYSSKDLSIRLMVDHAVPISFLVKMLFDDSAKADSDYIGGFLRRYYRLGVITSDENIRITRMGLSNRMPEDWDGCDPFARYRKVGIPAIFPTMSARVETPQQS